MFKAILPAFVALSLSATTFANSIEQDFPKQKAYAKSLKNLPQQAMQSFSPQDTFKKMYNEHPPEEGYYTTEEKIHLEEAATRAVQNDVAGKTVIENVGNHKFEINQNSDAIKQSKLIQDESYALTHGQSNTNIDCDVNPPVCEMKTHHEACTVSTQRPDRTCSRQRVVSTDKDHINQSVYASISVRKNFTGLVSINLITGEGGYVASPTVLKHACSAFSISNLAIKNNNQPANWVSIALMPNCSNNGLLALNVSKKFARDYNLQLFLTVDATSTPFESSEHWEDQCESLSKDELCHVVDEHCTESNQTKMIDGMPVTKDCWQSTSTYACKSAKSDECISQKEKGCLQISSRCSMQGNQGCALYEQVYSCQEKVCPSKPQCLKHVFCADGECAEDLSTENEEFGKSMSEMAAVGESAHEYNKTQSTLFAGRAVECKIWPINFIDCCSEEGWGEKINLVHCRDEDKALGQAKLDYLAHYVGEYCSVEVLGECVERKRSYCVFDTKMARIIQEEGRLKQLNPNALGSAKEPKCGGISVDELASLDMGKIEFLKPVYPFNKGDPTPDAGILPKEPETAAMLDELTRRVQKTVGGS